MKKLILALLLLVLLTGCSSDGSQTSANTVQASKDVSSESVSSTENGNSVVAKEGTVSSENLEIIKEYSIKTNQFSSYTDHILIIQNNNESECYVKSNSKAYDAGGNLLGIDDDSSSKIAPGYQGIIVEAFEDIDGVSKYETKLTAAESNYGKEINTIISMDLEANSSKVFVTLTNNGNYSAKSVCAYVIFLDSDGNCVDFASKYMEVTDSEIKPGESVSEEFKTDKTFSTADVYISGSGGNE